MWSKAFIRKGRGDFKEGCPLFGSGFPIGASSISVGTRLWNQSLRVVRDEGIFQTDFFTDAASLEKEKSLQEAMLGLKKRFGKNAVLKGSNYLEGATMRDRNGRIGGHKAK